MSSDEAALGRRRCRSVILFRCGMTRSEVAIALGVAPALTVGIAPGVGEASRRAGLRGRCISQSTGSFLWFGVRGALRGSQMSAQRRRFIVAPKYAHSLQLGHDRADEIGKRVR